MKSLCQVYEDWQANPTVNYLKTTGLPLSDIDFPSITICAQGSIYEVIISLNYLMMIKQNDLVIKRSRKMSSTTK